MKHLSAADQKLGFRIHAAAYVLGIIIMAIINVAVGPPWWIQWPLIGWTIGLVTHGWFVVGPGARPSP